MPLRLLLDENISRTVAEQASLRCPEMEIESVHRWRGGEFKNRKDEDLLRAAFAEGWTLVTYDRRSIPLLLRGLLERGESHAGVIYIDERTIAGRSLGLLIEALIELWQSEHGLDWRDRIYHLKKPSR